jgi:hypothetical protein
MMNFKLQICCLNLMKRLLSISWNFDIFFHLSYLSTLHNMRKLDVVVKMKFYRIVERFCHLHFIQDMIFIAGNLIKFLKLF